MSETTVFSSPESSIQKAFRATYDVIRLARKLTSYSDHREYLWGLLLNGLYINTLTLPASHKDIETTRRRRGWLLASIICGRLSAWDTAWPPPYWPKDRVPKGKAMMGDFEYDVFISYSAKDAAWVRCELLPRLERANLQVCIDYRDFKPGAPSVLEMERAIKTSRKTIAVLTPHYLTSAWTEFESLMLMTLDPASRERRFIPVLKEKCTLPTRIGYLVYVNLADPQDVELPWKQLLEALTDPANNA